MRGYNERVLLSIKNIMLILECLQKMHLKKVICLSRLLHIFASIID